MTTFYWIALLIFSHAVHAVISFAYRRWHREVKVFVAKEHGPYSPEWKDFIIANINSCIHPDQCYYCNELIKMYREMFKHQIPNKIYNDNLESMTNKLDTKFKVLRQVEETLTIDDFIN